jgi:hypothetical protein
MRRISHESAPGRRRWLVRIPTAFAATALLLAGLTAPAGAMRPAERSAHPSVGASCATDSHARVKQGYKGVDPNTRTAAQVRASQRDLVRQLHLLGITAQDVTQSGVIRISVHWHIILDNQGHGNVTNARIHDQMTVMNDGFAGRTSADASPTRFRFYTTSIDRTRNTDWYEWAYPGTDQSDDREAKNALGIKPQKELNAYVANLGDNLLGYATFPNQRPAQRQGLVILNESMPGGNVAPYNEGDTATHEIGHWLGLYHTFQNGCALPGDLVNDTPYQFDGDNIFFCDEADDTCKRPGKDPVHNFMSYGDDPCLDQFTKGQARRMVAQWMAFRG